MPSSPLVVCGDAQARMWSHGTRVCVPLWAAHATGVVTATAVLATCAEETPRGCLCALALISIVLTIALESAPRPPASSAPRFLYDPDETRAPSEAFEDGADKASEFSSEVSAASQSNAMRRDLSAHATSTTLCSCAQSDVPLRPNTSPTPSTL